MTTALIGLGSNSGDRTRHLRWALRRLGALPGTRVAGVSSVYETAPVGNAAKRSFHNAVAAVRTSLRPMTLLIELKRVEALRKRQPGPRWGPRPLDLDILFYGRERVAGRFLSIPHPLALRRRFVLAPLAELMANWQQPTLPRMNPARLLTRINPGAENVKMIGTL